MDLAGVRVGDAARDAGAAVAGCHPGGPAASATLLVHALAGGQRMRGLGRVNSVEEHDLNMLMKGVVGEWQVPSRDEAGESEVKGMRTLNYKERRMHRSRSAQDGRHGTGGDWHARR